VKRVIDIWQSLLPQRIYADVGYGATQAEMVYSWAKANEKPTLMECFKSIDFSETVDISSHLKGAYMSDEKAPKTKTRYKTLMIKLLSEALKEGRLALPAFEDKEDGLIHEIRAFKLKEIGMNGEPTYSKEGGQHTHMALCLAMLACYEFHKDQFKKDADSGLASERPDIKTIRKMLGIQDRPARTEALQSGDSLDVLGSRSFRSPFSSTGRRFSRRSSLNDD